MGRIFSRWAASLGAALAAALGPVAASPWGQAPGDSLSILKIDYYRSSEDDRSFDQIVLESYAEQGFSELWSLGGKVGYGWQQIDTPSLADSREGLVAAEIFAQRQVFASGVHEGAIQLQYGFETSTRSIFFGNEVDGADAHIELAGLWGAGNEVAFITTRAGYRASLGDDADQARVDLAAGMHLPEDAIFLVETFSTTSLGEAEAGGTDYDQVSAAASLVTRIAPRTRLQFGGRVDLFTDGIDKGAGAFIALWVEP